MAVEDGSAEQSLDDVLLLVRPGVDVFVDGERAGPNMIGDPPRAAAVLARRIVFPPADFRRGLDQRAEDVDVEVRLHALENGGRALQAHAGVDVLARQRPQIARRIADAIELGKHEVPDFHFAELGVEIDFAARAAYAVGPLARRVGRPEILAFVESLEL